MASKGETSGTEREFCNSALCNSALPLSKLSNERQHHKRLTAAPTTNTHSRILELYFCVAIVVAHNQLAASTVELCQWVSWTVGELLPLARANSSCATISRAAIKWQARGQQEDGLGVGSMAKLARG